jgi:ketosteroid isomerase-like protein
VNVTDDDLAHVVRSLKESARRFQGDGTRGVDEYYAEFYAPDGVIEHVDDFPMPGRFEGLDGYREWFRDAYGPYEDVVFRVETVRPEGDCVLALMTISGRSKGDNVELAVQLGNTYALREGKIAYVRVYVGHERAVEAARSGG